MSHATWPLEEASGVPALDQLHHDLFKTLDKLSCARDDDFKSGFGALVSQAEQAFELEEQWMEQIDFHSMKVHREQHARVLGALHNVHSRVMNDELGVGRHVVDELLPQWFALHTSTMDTNLAHAIQIAQAAAYGTDSRIDPAHAPH